MRRSKLLALLLLTACKSSSEPEPGAGSTAISAPTPSAPAPATSTQVAEPGSYFWLAGDKLERRRAFAPDVLEAKLDAVGLKAPPAAAIGSNAAGDRLIFVTNGAVWRLDASDPVPKKIAESPLLSNATLAFRG
ncbi:MAG TPA: hypothetical protein VM686_31310, partial [Polyangiaceae bacterium]|nr:hypothetical protein [Polyangiaceae bacterium]